MPTYIADPNGLLQRTRRYVVRDGSLVPVRARASSSTGGGTTPVVVPPAAAFDYPGRSLSALPARSTTPVASLALSAASAPASFGADTLAPGVITHIAGTSFVNTERGGTTNKVFSKIAAETVGVARDVSVEGFAWAGSFQVRKQADGRCFELSTPGFDNSNRVTLNLIGEGGGIVKYLYDSTDLPGPIPSPFGSYSGTATQGYRFRLSAEGLNIKAEFSTQDGAPGTWTTFYDRPAGVDLMEAGKTVWTVNNSVGHGHERLTFTHLSDAPLWSDAERVGDGGYANLVFDVRDIGYADLSAVGSMAQGSNLLPLDGPNPGFEVGMGILVETGGEAGQGARGTTDGVGGYYPGQAVATVADLPTNAPTFSKRLVLADSKVYITYNDGASWGLAPTYYDVVPVPLALSAKITAIDGNVLTLDTPAVNPTAGANIYHDNAQTALWDTSDGGFLVRNHTDPAFGFTLRHPEGNFRLQDTLSLTHHGLVFEGSGKWRSSLRAVKGARAFGLRLTGNGTKVHHLGFYGNIRDEGYGENVNSSAVNSLGNSTVTEDCVSFNMGDSFKADFGYQATLQRLICYTGGNRKYFQWQVAVSDGYENLIQDISVVADRLQPGFEAFRSPGSIIRRVFGHNATVSNNSTDGVTYEDFHLYFEADSADEAYLNALYNPVVNLNMNINNSSGGTLLANMTIRRVVIALGGLLYSGPAGNLVIPGFNNPPGRMMYNGINISSPEKWDTCAISDVVYWVPPAQRGLGVTPAAVGGDEQATNTFTTTRVRSWGNHGADYPGGDIGFSGATGTGTSRIEDSQANSTLASTVLNVQTPAAWLASRPATPPPVCDFRVVGIRGEGSYDLYAYDVDADGVMTYLPTSTWSVSLEFVWEHLRGGVLLATTYNAYASLGGVLPGDQIRLTVRDELEQTATLTKTIA